MLITSSGAIRPIADDRARINNDCCRVKSGVVHLRAITGLRFVAAFFVFVSHIRYFVYPEEYLLPIGGPAVTFFFVLSGFILTWVYQKRLKLSNVKRFYVTRWARIWPLHVACLLICLLLTADPPGRNPAVTNSWPSLVAQFLMLQSWIPVQYWFTDFNSVSWSISTEMFFYLLFPLLLLGDRKWFWLKFVGVAVIALGFLGFTQYLVNNSQVPAWMSTIAVSISLPLVRMLEFVLGMATCFLMIRLHGTVSTQRAAGGWRFWIDSAWELLALSCVFAWWFMALEQDLAGKISNSVYLGYVFGNWFRVAGGMLLYAFAWEPERSRSRRRFLHVCDASGDYLRHGPGTRSAFRRAQPYRAFVEQVVLTPEHLQGAKSICIGFWSHEIFWCPGPASDRRVGPFSTPDHPSG